MLAARLFVWSINYSWLAESKVPLKWGKAASALNDYELIKRVGTTPLLGFSEHPFCAIILLLSQNKPAKCGNIWLLRIIPFNHVQLQDYKSRMAEAKQLLYFYPAPGPK